MLEYQCYMKRGSSVKIYISARETGDLKTGLSLFSWIWRLVQLPHDIFRQSHTNTFCFLFLSNHNSHTYPDTADMRKTACGINAPIRPSKGLPRKKQRLMPS